MPAMPLLRPRRLTPGQTVGLVAPSAAPNDPEHIRFAIDTLESLGFRVRPGAHVFDRDGYFAGSDEESARLHMEREEVGIPFAVWPEQGDRVQAYGSWVWDCEHSAGGGVRTEFHPIRALWVERQFSPRSPSGEAEHDALVAPIKCETRVAQQRGGASVFEGVAGAFSFCWAKASARRIASAVARLASSVRPSLRSCAASSACSDPFSSG